MTKRSRCIALTALCCLLTVATSASAEEGACEWQFNVGDHLIARKDGRDLGVIVQRAEKHRFMSGAVGCAYILRHNAFDDARAPRVLHEIAKVGTPPAPPDCNWRFNVGDFLVSVNDGSEVGLAGC
jgi:hypothetical protein